jgi:hypothetical protein
MQWVSRLSFKGLGKRLHVLAGAFDRSVTQWLLIDHAHYRFIRSVHEVKMPF